MPLSYHSVGPAGAVTVVISVRTLVSMTGVAVVDELGGCVVLACVDVGVEAGADVELELELEMKIDVEDAVDDGVEEGVGVDVGV